MKNVLEKHLRIVGNHLIIVDKQPSVESILRRQIRHLKARILSIQSDQEKILAIKQENKKLKSKLEITNASMTEVN